MENKDDYQEKLKKDSAAATRKMLKAGENVFSSLFNTLSSKSVSDVVNNLTDAFTSAVDTCFAVVEKAVIWHYQKKAAKPRSLTVEQFNNACAAFDNRVADRTKPPITRAEIKEIVSTATDKKVTLEF